MAQYSEQGNTTNGNSNTNNKNNKTASKRSKYSQTDLNRMADKLLGEVQTWIKDGTKNFPRYVSATVSKVYEDGTVDIYLPGSKDEKFTRIQNQSVFDLKEGDDVEVILKNGSFSNCWIVACHNPYSQARLNAVQYRNVGGSASGGGSSSGGSSGGGGITITRLSQLQNDVGFITGNAPTINNANLTGVPNAPTAEAGTNTTQVATTAFVQNAINNLNIPPDYGDQITQINNNITNLTNNINTLTTNITALQEQMTNVLSQLQSIDQRLTALEESGGTGTDWTEEITDLQNRMTTVEGNITNLTTQVATKASTDSPALTGIPTGPTAAEGTSSTQLATTEFVQQAIASIPGGGTGGIDAELSTEQPTNQSEGDLWFKILE